MDKYRRSKLEARKLTIVYRGQGREVRQSFQPKFGGDLVKKSTMMMKQMTKKTSSALPRGNVLLKNSDVDAERKGKGSPPVFDPMNVRRAHFEGKNKALEHVVLVKKYDKGASYVRTLNPEGKTIDSMYNNGRGHVFYHNCGIENNGRKYSYYQNLTTGKRVVKAGAKKHVEYVAVPPSVPGSKIRPKNPPMATKKEGMKKNAGRTHSKTATPKIRPKNPPMATKNAGRVLTQSKTAPPTMMPALDRVVTKIKTKNSQK